MTAALGSPELAEPLVILAGKGPGKAEIARGIELTTQFQLTAIMEYFRRLERAGLTGRPERSKFTRLLTLIG